MNMCLPFHQRLIALLLALVYACTSTAALPAMIGWVAEIEGSHTVTVAKSASGMQITLHHVRGDYTPKIADHRSALARVMVSMCRVSTSGDHHLEASQLNEAPNACRDRLADAISMAGPASAWPVQTQQALPPGLALRINRVLKARQSFDDRRLTSTRLATTRLLI